MADKNKLLSNNEPGSKSNFQTSLKETANKLTDFSRSVVRRSSPNTADSNLCW